MQGLKSRRIPPGDWEPVLLCYDNAVLQCFQNLRVLLVLS